MKKEEILEKSRAENQGMDEMEAYVLRSAGGIAMRVGLLLCCLMAVLEVMFTDQVSVGSWTIYFGMLGTMFLVKALKLRRRHEIALTVLFYGLCALFFALWLVRMLG